MYITVQAESRGYKSILVLGTGTYRDCRNETEALNKILLDVKVLLGRN